jgi:hypothetical protein
MRIYRKAIWMWTLFDESDIDRPGAKGILGTGTAQPRLAQPCRLIRLSSAAGLIVRHHKNIFPEDSDEKQDF